MKVFLVICLVIGGVSGLIGRRAAIQAQGVKQIKKLGGKVQYDFVWQKNIASTSLLRVFGPSSVDLFSDVVAVDLSGCEFQEWELELDCFPALQRLWLEDSNISDLGFVENCSNLIELNVANTQISSIESLGRLKKLEYLTLSNTEVEDIQDLKRLTSLEQLVLPSELSASETTELRDALPNCKFDY